MIVRNIDSTLQLYTKIYAILKSVSNVLFFYFYFVRKRMSGCTKYWISIAIQMSKSKKYTMQNEMETQNKKSRESIWPIHKLIFSTLKWINVFELNDDDGMSLLKRTQCKTMQNKCNQIKISSLNQSITTATTIRNTL